MAVTSTVSFRRDEYQRPAPCRLRAAVSFAWLLTCLALTGCQTLDIPAAPPLIAATEAEPPAVAELDPALAEELHTLLSLPAWQVDVRWSVLATGSHQPTCRWRSIYLPRVEPSATSKLPENNAPPPPSRWQGLWDGTGAGFEATEREAITAQLERWRTQDDAVATNATILLARWTPEPNAALCSALQMIAEDATATETTAKLPLATRCAAAEAWCRALRHQPGDWQDTLVPAGKLLERPGLPDELRSTLWRTLAERVPPDRLPGLSRTLAERRSLPLRRTALEACVVHAATLIRLTGCAVNHPGHNEELGATVASSLPCLDDVHTAAKTQPWHPEIQQFGEERLRSAETASGNDLTLWPETLTTVRLDADPLSRQLFARWVGLSRPAQAITWLTALQRDVDGNVREQAIHGLGCLGSDEARDTLRQIAKQSGDRQRAVAVTALAKWGDDELTPFVTDASPTVRVAAVAALARFPHDATSRWLRNAFVDPSLDVQSAAVSAVSEWPDELATPILLDAVQSASLRTRQKAQAALQTRWGHDVSFPVEAGLTERQAAVRKWAAERGLVLGPVISTAAMSPVQIDDPQRAARLAELLQSLLSANVDREARLSEKPGFDARLPKSSETSEVSPHALTADQLDQLRATATPGDVGLIEQHLAQRTDADAETILREVLPTLSPVYATLAPLAERDVTLRRQAARQLAQIAVDHPLSPVFLQRVHTRLTHEQDQQVWQACMSAIQRESHPEAGQIALLALHNTWPDVRRLGVEYIAQHPASESAAWLLPAFRDSQRSVRLAAIAAAGRCGHPLALEGLPASAQSPGQPGLRPLLTDTDAELRQAALLAMARLRDEQACQELVRLTFEPHPVARETAVRTMGQSGQSRFVEPLLKLLWTEPADGVRLAILTSLETLVPVENQPPPPTGLAAPPSIDDKVRLWTAWWTATRDPALRSAR